VFGDATESTRQSVLAAAEWRSMGDAEKQVIGCFAGMSLLLFADGRFRCSLISPKQRAPNVNMRRAARNTMSGSDLSTSTQ
jgi:hypothetical protein